MIKCHIERGKRSEIEARGSAMEIATSIAVVINSIHTEFQNADPETAAAFRKCLTAIINKPESPVWKPLDGHNGIIYQIPGEEESE